MFCALNRSPVLGGMKKNLLLLVQSESHAAALPAFAQSIHGKYDGIWLLFSPACLVDEASASKEHDRNITALNKAIENCKTSEDFDGAKAYKEKRDAALLEKATRVKESWKTLSEADRKAAEDRLLDGFAAAKPAPNMRLEMLKEHYEPAQFIDALNSVRKAWFVPFVPGTFDLKWPHTNGSVPAASDKAAPKLSVPAPAAEKKPDMRKHPRIKILSAMNLIQLGDHATSIGINPNNKNIQALRYAVLRKEIELGKVPA